MFGTNLPTSADDTRSLWEIYDQFFPRVELGNCSPLVLSDDIGDIMRSLKKTHHRLFLSVYHDLAAQAVCAEDRILKAIGESMSGNPEYADANMEMLAVTREISDEHVSEEVKRDIIQLMMDQRESLKEAFDNPNQEQAARFPSVAVIATDQRPIMEIYNAFFTNDGYSTDIHDLIMELFDTENPQTCILLNELGGHHAAIDDLLFEILERNSRESGEYVETCDLQDCHLLPGEKVRLVQEMIDQREILMYKIIVALGRSS